MIAKCPLTRRLASLVADLSPPGRGEESARLTLCLSPMGRGRAAVHAEHGFAMKSARVRGRCTREGA